MKRDHRDSSSSSSSSSKMASGKGKIIEAEAGEDELLAVLGYKVRTSDMADVAQKLEQLEMVMYNGQEDGISHLSSDTVHYNPSDISTWLESMLSEFNIPAESSQQHQFPQFCDSDCSDLFAIPGDIVFGKVEEREKKRMKPAAESGRPVVLVDSQEMGIRLVHTLIACAKAIHCNNLDSADVLVKQIGVLAASQAGAMGKVATYFAEALARRIYKIRPSGEGLDSFSDMLQLYFYDSCPYLKFAHFTANQAILEAFDGKSRVHVIDFSMKQGMQWPALIQALAVRPGGPPTFRLTGIGPPQRDNTDNLKQVGSKLGQLADTINVEFSYQGIVANSLADIEAAMLDVHFEDCEAVAVNSVFELHRLLARPGAIDKVLTTIKALRPKIVTVVEQEADHNVPDFLDRFNEALHYYSTMFDSLEGCGMSLPDGQDQVMSEVYLGTQICNVVACEGVERVERHEKLVRWQARMRAAGFSPVHLGSNAFKQASMLLALFGSGDGYRVEENDGCLMLGWHTRPLIATSAWHIVEQEGGTNSSRYQAVLS